MKYKKIYLGSWALGSTIHLKELYQALAYQKSSYFSPKEIRAWQKGIDPVSINYLTQAINSVRGELKNELVFDILEDGVIILSKEIQDLKKDHEHLNQFMNTKMRTFWDNLSSRDVALPKIFSEQEVANPIVVVVEKASEPELEEIFGQFKTIPYKKVALEQGRVWIGEHVVVLNDVKISEENLLETARYLMFARLYELQLKTLLDVQRTMWNQIEAIRYKKYYKSSELTEMRDKALLIQSNAVLLKNRLKQMSRFLIWREKLIDRYLPDHILNTIFKDFFLSLKSTQEYLNELWEMTATHANGTVESISLLYSDTQQKELRTLQKFFLVSTVTAVLSLGALAGSRMITIGPDNKIISRGAILSWEWESFLYYSAIAIGISVIFYILLYFVFTKFQQARNISPKENNKKKK